MCGQGKTWNDKRLAAENLDLKSRMAKLELEVTDKAERLKKVVAEVLKVKEALEKILELDLHVVNPSP